MWFYLLKDKDVELAGPNSRPQLSPPFEELWQQFSARYAYLQITEETALKRCRLTETISSLIPVMSEQRNGKGFWNIQTVGNCGTVLINEMRKSSAGLYTLDVPISISCTSSTANKVTFSVTIENCMALKDIFNACGEKAKLILEMYFKMPFLGEPTLAGLVTPEMSITSEKNEFTCKAEDFLVTDAMGKFWAKNTSSFGISIQRFPQLCASCNLALIVSDDLPLFRLNLCSDNTRRILEEAIHSDFEIITSDGAVVKCHKSFLTVQSPVLERMLETDMTESSSNRMKVEDMDKSVVVAFLKFLYCKDLPTDDLSLSLQLLEVAHKYEVGLLEQATLALLIQKDDIYFSVELAWEVYAFVRNIPNGTDLKEKMIKIIAGEWTILDEKFRQVICNTDNGSALKELMPWILELYGECEGVSKN